MTSLVAKHDVGGTWYFYYIYIFLYFICRNSTYCMKVSMSLTVAEQEVGLCYNSRIRYVEKAEVTKTKVISCPDIDDYKTPNASTDVAWYKVSTDISIICCKEQHYPLMLKLTPINILILQKESIHIHTHPLLIGPVICFSVHFLYCFSAFL